MPPENEPEPIEDLDCSFADFEETQCYSSVGQLAKKQQDYTKFFELTEGGMRLPTVKGAIHSNPRLDAFVASEFDRFSRPQTRQFGENSFTVIPAESGYAVGHLERYCGPTLQVATAILRTKSGGPIVAFAHTHPYFRGVRVSRERNREGRSFGPGDWTPLVAFGAPVFLYTPRREVRIMEYDGNFVTVRQLGGEARKWRVSRR